MNKGAGAGQFNWTSVADARKEIPEMFNLVNPPMRGASFQLYSRYPWAGKSLICVPDTFTTIPAFQGPSWMAVRYHGMSPTYLFTVSLGSCRANILESIVQNPGVREIQKYLPSSFMLTKQAFLLHCHIDPHLTGGMT